VKGGEVGKWEKRTGENKRVTGAKKSGHGSKKVCGQNEEGRRGKRSCSTERKL